MIVVRLRAAREDAGLTQGELADRLGIARSTYTQIETGRNSLSVEYLIQLPGILGRPVNYFLGMSDNQELPDSEALVLDSFRSLPAEAKRLALASLRSWVEEYGGRIGQPLTIHESPAPYDTQAPDTEKLLAIISRLAPTEVALVYDFARWRLALQVRRQDDEGEWTFERLHTAMVPLSSDQRKALLELVYKNWTRLLGPEPPSYDLPPDRPEDEPPPAANNDETEAE